jgi:hypothetical protein
MVYNTPNHSVCGLCLSSGILNNLKTTLWKQDLFLPSGEGRDTPTLLGILERANSMSGPNSRYPSHLKMDTDPVPKMCFIVI